MCTDVGGFYHAYDVSRPIVALWSGECTLHIDAFTYPPTVLSLFCNRKN